MILSAESCLVLLALGLYLYDSTLLLRTNELVLEQRGAGKWVPRFGANQWRFSRREPLLINPLIPWRLLRRTRWSHQKALSSPDAQTFSGRDLSRNPGVAATALLVTTFVAFPFALFIYPVTALKLLVIVTIYMLVALTLILIYLERDKVKLVDAAFWKLCLECIACPPFCINAPRKLGLAASMPLILSDFSGEDFENLKDGLVIRLRERIAFTAEGSDELAAMQSFLHLIESGDSG